MGGSFLYFHSFRIIADIAKLEMNSIILNAIGCHGWIVEYSWKSVVLPHVTQQSFWQLMKSINIKKSSLQLTFMLSASETIDANDFKESAANK